MNKRRFAAFDIDGTFYRSHLFWEVFLEQARQQALHPTLNEYVLDLYKKWKARSYEDAFETFENESIVAFEKLLLEIDPREYDRILESVLTPLLDHTYTYTKNLSVELKKKGYVLLALSGSRIEEVSIFAKHHGFDYWVGQYYERSANGSRYTGKTNKTYKDKHLILDKLVKEHGLTYEDSYAVGDSGTDISLLETVKNPIAFNPNKVLLAHARKVGWDIVVERKSIVYTLKEQSGNYLLA